MEWGKSYFLHPVLLLLILRAGLIHWDRHADSGIRFFLGMVDMRSSRLIINKDFLKWSPNQLELQRR